MPGAVFRIVRAFAKANALVKPMQKVSKNAGYGTDTV